MMQFQAFHIMMNEVCMMRIGLLTSGKACAITLVPKWTSESCIQFHKKDAHEIAVPSVDLLSEASYANSVDTPAYSLCGKL
jgi:hypothetical protein